MDITGQGCLNFCTRLRKITSKFAPPGAGAPDEASFIGDM